MRVPLSRARIPCARTGPYDPVSGPCGAERHHVSARGYGRRALSYGRPFRTKIRG